MNTPHDATDDLRGLMRTGLVAAMKARRPEEVSALRTAIAAIDNASTVAVAEPASAAGSEGPAASEGPIAGARIGLGAAEAERRALTPADLRHLLQAQIDDRIAEAERYDAHAAHDAAERLRLEASALEPYLRSVDGR